MKILFFLLLFINIGLTQERIKSHHGIPPLPYPNFVDLSKYAGKWNVIASLPKFFLKGCIRQTAEYKVLSKNSMSVFNTCIKGNGKISTIKGKAIVTNFYTNAELEVSFEAFFTKIFRSKGDYNIIQIDPNYEFVMVGSKNRKSLWIMSRKTIIPLNILNNYVALAKTSGFDVSKLIFSKF